MGDGNHQVKSSFLFIIGHFQILFIPGHFQDSVYTRSLLDFVYKSGGVISITPVSMGRPEHSHRAIATALAQWLPRSASPWLRLAGVPNVHSSGWQGLASYCSGFGQSGFYRDTGVWTLGARQQRVDDSRPLSNSSPSLSCRTSHLRPSRPSREGFSAGLQ